MRKKIIVERDVEAKMRDGVVLRTDVYRPGAPESVPVLLQRTPYGKGFSQISFALMAAARDASVGRHQRARHRFHRRAGGRRSARLRPQRPGRHYPHRSLGKNKIPANTSLT
ncbi:MAG TPA: hypothetical protein G4N99_08510 [Thermoflexia bacterium]|nr:hypothetical protein [Thermoflexia bacterium]